MLLPSRWEALGISLMEAMAMGIPVVAAAVGGIPEVVESERTGLLVDGRDPKHFAAAIRRLAMDDGLRQRVIAGAQRVVADRFSRRQMFQQYLSLYENLLASCGTPM